MLCIGRRGPMKRLLAFFAIAFIVLFSVYSGRGYVETSISPLVPFAGFISEEGKESYLDTNEILSTGMSYTIEGYYEIRPWFALGGVVEFDLNDPYEKIGMLFTNPFYLSLRFSPGNDTVRVPLSILAGGHFQSLDEVGKFGVSVGISAGIAFDVSEKFTLSSSVRMLALLQFGSEGRIASQLFLVPASIGFRTYF